MRFISKISGNRVCIYLNSKNIVDKLVSGKIIVNQNIISARPYIEKNKRVVISNVSPHIPHNVIIQSLALKGITVVSQMHHIKASSSKAGRAHIMSFRRQIYIKEEDVPLLPESLQITYDESTHWIFLSTESANCFLCKQSGHIAKVCPSAQTENQNITDIPNYTSTIETGVKRPAPSTVSADSHEQNLQNTENMQSNQPEEDTLKNGFMKPKAKKLRKNKIYNSTTEYSDSDDVTTKLPNSVKTALEDRDSTSKQLPLDFDAFSRFLNETYGKTNAIEIAATFTDDTEGLIEMLDISYTLVTENKLKARIARLKKKRFKNHLIIRVKQTQTPHLQILINTRINCNTKKS